MVSRIVGSLRRVTFVFLCCALWLACRGAQATPVNKVGLEKYYSRFLAKPLNACTTCHLPAKLDHAPANLAEFPHNPFGHRLAVLGEQLRKAGKKADIAVRLEIAAREDSDKDGVDNLTEILLNHAPGDPADKPTMKELSEAPRLRADFLKFLSSYRWQPFESVRRPVVPKVKNAAWVRNPIDAFIAAEHEGRGLRPRPAATKGVLLRRVTLDLIGLSPTPEELRAFENDTSPNAYEKVVDRLLADPRYGERWARHWMDVWRYSDWAGWADGNQIRDSKPFIWRWRDWIVESLNKDKGYDRMVQEMLAADELAPEDTDALRATGFLVRNFKLLSREQWLEDTINHTSKAFLGLTMHCAKCHDHMYDPIKQREYYAFRALFEPHNVRNDRIPGQPDTNKDGLVRAYDAEVKAPTYFFVRGDERHPDKSAAIPPGIPESLGGTLKIEPVTLPRLAVQPDKREFVIKETVEASAKAVEDARKAAATSQADTKATPEQKAIAAQAALVAEAKHASLLAVLKVEKLEDAGQKDSDAWKQAATETTTAQRKGAAAEAELNVLTAKQAVANAQAQKPANMSGFAGGKNPGGMNLAMAQAKLAEAEKALTAAKTALASPPSTAFTPRPMTTNPAESTGRRLAFARWLTDPKNPLAARVAINHLWTRHFGQGLVPNTADFGRNSRPPSHPQLLDWLAAELMSPSLTPRPPSLAAPSSLGKGEAQSKTPLPVSGGGRGVGEGGWSMKRLHRLIVTSNTYRMASTPDDADAKVDPDNVYLWRMPSHRMEAEVVRDNLLYVAGHLDLTQGGPDIDQGQGLTSKRRSIYLRHAAEKQTEFLQIFDGPSVTECYERKQSVMPQQALALANSELAQREAHSLADALSAKTGPDNGRFITEAFLRVLSRPPTAEERKLCADFLTQKPRSSPQTTALPDNGGGTAQAPNASRPTPELRARENLILVLFNHHDFVTIR